MSGKETFTSATIRNTKIDTASLRKALKRKRRMKVHEADNINIEIRGTTYGGCSPSPSEPIHKIVNFCKELEISTCTTTAQEEGEYLCGTCIQSN